MLGGSKEALNKKKGQDTDSDDDINDSSNDDSVDIDVDQMTPKQSLINGLIRLGDPKSKKYSLADREHFVIDFENILKVLTFQETVMYIFPALDVFAAEQEYLKIELFKQIPHVFKKLMTSPAKKSEQDALDLLTVNIFPLISQILMTSDDNVQFEGVSALLKISEEFLPREEANFLVFNVVQLLSKKADQIENAKIAVLMLMEKFAENNYFEAKECAHFLQTCYEPFMKNAMFKVKKQLLPCLLAISKHMPYEVYSKTIMTNYFNFSKDGIWGVRRVSIELLPQFLEKLKETETERLCQGLAFLTSSLDDDSKWVRNQAFAQFGKAVH